MKVLLIVPSILAEYVRPIKPTCPHTGVSYLASILIKNAHEVEVLDMRLYPKVNYAIRKIRDFKPDFIGVNCVSMGYMEVYRLIDEIKKWFDIPLVVGGPHVSVLKEKILEESKADFAIIGEGEYTLLDLVNGKKPEDIFGLIWKNNGTIIRNSDREFIQNLDDLPFPAYELSPLDMYIDKKISIVSSRGCPYNCVYCSIRLSMGQKFRARSAENVVKEIEHWHKKGYKYFQFTDDNFSFDMKRAEKICDILIEKNIKIKWDLRNGLRVDRVTYPLLLKMKRSGCFFIAYGIESANQEVLNAMKKGITARQARKAIGWTKKAGIKVGAFFMIGNPKDNLHRFYETLKFAESLKLDEVRFYNVLPYPGTELFLLIKKEGSFLRQPEEYLNDFSYWSDKPVFETKEFQKEERAKAYRVGERYVMKYLLKREFGSVLGLIGFVMWKNRFMRNITAGPAILLWRIARKIK